MYINIIHHVPSIPSRQVWTVWAVFGTARCEPEDPLDMEVLSSVRGRVLDVFDGALDDATGPPLTPEPRIKSSVSIRCWAHSLNKLGSIRKNWAMHSQVCTVRISWNGTMMKACAPWKYVVVVKIRHTCITPDSKLVATETTHSQEHLHKHPVPMARYQGQNKKGTPFVMNIKSNVPCHLILQTYVIFQLELWIKVTFGHHCTIEISVTLRHYS